MNIFISEENGRVKLDCQITVSSVAGHAVAIRKTEMNIFLKNLNKNLNKK